VAVSNLSTAPIFFAEHVGLAKVEIGRKYLERNGVTAVAHALWFDEAVHAGRIFVQRPDLVIPVANERDVRRQIQHQVPPLLGNVADFVTIGRPRSGDCICGGQRGIWKQLNAPTLFAGLSDE
jgi:hypothetical protein